MELSHTVKEEKKDLRIEVPNSVEKKSVDVKFNISEEVPTKRKNGVIDSLAKKMGLRKAEPAKELSATKEDSTVHGRR